MFKKTLYFILAITGGYLGMLIPSHREETATSQFVGFTLAFCLTLIAVDHYYLQWRERRKKF